MTAAIAASGQYPDSKWQDFNPAYRQLQRMQAKRSIPEDTARVFMPLLEAGKVPRFVLDEVDVEMFRLAAED